MFPSSPSRAHFFPALTCCFLLLPSHWALGKPVEKVVILEQEKYLPSWVSGVAVGVTGAFDVVASVEKYLTLLLKPLRDNITNNNSF